MNPLKLPSKKQSKSSQTDEFEQAALAEYQKGYVRLNLMADALQKSEGDAEQARVLYLQQVAEKLQKEQKIKAQLQQQAPATSKASVGIIQRCTDWIADYWYILPLLLLIGLVLSNNPKLLTQQATELLGFGQDKSTTTTNHWSVGEQHADPQQIGADLQQQYSVLDPNHPDYQAGLVAQVQNISQQYQQQGQPLAVAQQAAALSVLGRPSLSSDRQVSSYVPRDGKVQIPTEQPAAAASACQQKPVMSNQDYLDCGLQPPSNSSDSVVEDFNPVF